MGYSPNSLTHNVLDNLTHTYWVEQNEVEGLSHPFIIKQLNEIAITFYRYTWEKRLGEFDALVKET